MPHAFSASQNLTQQEWKPILVSKSSCGSFPKLVLYLRFQFPVSQVICLHVRVALRKVKLEGVKLRQGQSQSEKHKAWTSLPPPSSTGLLLLLPCLLHLPTSSCLPDFPYLHLPFPAHICYESMSILQNDIPSDAENDFMWKWDMMWMVGPESIVN